MPGGDPKRVIETPKSGFPGAGCRMARHCVLAIGNEKMR
jgi:hypothetical protein